VLFPVGGLRKSRVREMAAAAGLPTASRRDSYGICFVGKRTLDSFLGQYAVALAPGRMVEAETGRDVGEV
jgi:tRNA-uridine 2-sulfurtransferase